MSDLHLKAYHRMAKAMRQDKLRKPIRCQKCKKVFPHHKIQAHHVDYRKPLKVFWVCDRCHKAIHKLLRWFKRCIAFLEYCKRTGLNPEDAKLPHLHKTNGRPTGRPTGSTHFEYWRNHIYEPRKNHAL